MPFDECTEGGGGTQGCCHREEKKDKGKRLKRLDRQFCPMRRRSLRLMESRLIICGGTFRGLHEIGTLSDGICHLGAIRVALGGAGWVWTSPRSRPIALSWITRREFTCQTLGGLWKGRWGGGAFSLLPRPLLYSSLLNTPTPSLPHFRRLSSHNHHLCSPNFPKRRGRRDRCNWLTLAIHPSCQRVNLSPAGLTV